MLMISGVRLSSAGSCSQARSQHPASPPSSWRTSRRIQTRMLGIQSLGVLGASNLAQPWPDLLLPNDPEAQVLIQRAIPGDVVKGAKRQGAHRLLDRPALHGPDERTGESPSLMGWLHADLGDVGAVVDDVDHDEADGPVRPLGGHPATTGLGVCHQESCGHRLGVSNVGHAHICEPLTREALDNAQKLGLARASGTDHRHARTATARDLVRVSGLTGSLG
jgi:hypothetical protein